MNRENDPSTFPFVRSLNPAVQALERIVQEIAPTSIPVLLVGESGTGKEVFAFQIHRHSARQEAPLLKMSCSSLDADSLGGWLQEAKARHNGTPAAGTLFLDEISDLDAACQRALLHALSEGETFSGKCALPTRTIASTCHNLEDEIHLGRFRSDLYYRINGICLRLPPLRQRKEDIPSLAEAFLSKHSAQFGREQRVLSARTLDAFFEHDWPGNIRELENVVKKIVALGDEQVAVADLAPGSKNPTSVSETMKLSLKSAARRASFQAERELILKTLARTRWNRKRAAQELQISYKSLLGKLKQIRLEDSEFHEV